MPHILKARLRQLPLFVGAVRHIAREENAAHQAEDCERAHRHGNPVAADKLSQSVAGAVRPCPHGLMFDVAFDVARELVGGNVAVLRLRLNGLQDDASRSASTPARELTSTSFGGSPSSILVRIANGLARFTW